MATQTPRANPRATTAQAAPGRAKPAAPAPAPQVPAVRASQAVALPAAFMAELAAEAKDAAAKERPAISRISLKAGQMAYGGDPVPGNNLDVVIIGGAYRNVWYSGPYDPDNPINPDCFAMADDEEGIAPHENVVKPVHETCTGCPNAEWGSAMKNGRPSRGKACKQTRRLVLLPASALDDGADGVLAAELAVLDVPVTSVKNYGTLVNTLSATVGLPMWAAITNVAVHPHPRNQFEVTFQPLAPAGDEAIIRALMKRREEALRISLTPYEGTGGEADPEAVAGNNATKKAAPVKANKKF